jgi:Uma2 family endonuclease
VSAVTVIGAEEYLSGSWERGSQLVGGEVVVTDPRLRHQELVARLLEALRAWYRSGVGRGMAGIGGNWVLGPGDVYCPDVWWVADPDRLDLDALSNEGGPDLAVEVRSPSTWHLDIGRKRSIYEGAGVAELWLVDTPAAAVIVARRSEPRVATFDQSAEYGPGTTLVTPLLEGFELSVDTLFT